MLAAFAPLGIPLEYFDVLPGSPYRAAPQRGLDSPG